MEDLDLELTAKPPAQVPSVEKASAKYEKAVADLGAIVDKLA